MATSCRLLPKYFYQEGGVTTYQENGVTTYMKGSPRISYPLLCPIPPLRPSLSVCVNCAVRRCGLNVGAQLPPFFCSWKLSEKGCGGGTTAAVYPSLPGVTQVPSHHHSAWGGGIVELHKGPTRVYVLGKLGSPLRSYPACGFCNIPPSDHVVFVSVGDPSPSDFPPATGASAA